MASLQQAIDRYTSLLADGELQRAYKGILSYMASLQTQLTERFPSCAGGALYQGYMDMTYFALTPPELRERKLKIALVYLHVEHRFELWLAANNRALQAETAKVLSAVPLGEYRVTPPAPGVDAVIEKIVLAEPDFDQPERMTNILADAFASFSADMLTLIDKAG
jgi:hypothetical protein